MANVREIREMRVTPGALRWIAPALVLVTATVLALVACNKETPASAGPYQIAGNLYAVSSPRYYTGVAIGANAPSQWSSGPFAVTPALPDGLSLDTTTGVISGTPTAASPAKIYTVRCNYDHCPACASTVAGDSQGTITIRVDDLPTEVTNIAPGYAFERVAGGLAVPDKIAVAPDGRLFINELTSGNTLVMTPPAEAGTGVYPTPTVWAHTDVLTGVEQGLLGIAVAPDFTTSKEIFVMACVDTPPRQQIIRFKETATAGSPDKTVIVDNLPEAVQHNGGDLKFLLDGTLFVSVGTTSDDNLAQDNASLAGRFLRYNRDGTVPADNPNPASPEYARGVRNAFGMCVHPSTGEVFATENGPANNDELLWVRPAKNFGWPSLPPGTPGADVGTNLRVWPTVIVPTGLTWASFEGHGPANINHLFLASYGENHVLRFTMSGALFTDIDSEDVLLQFTTTGFTHKPLDVAAGPDGTSYRSLYVSTFEGVWRVWKPH